MGFVFVKTTGGNITTFSCRKSQHGTNTAHTNGRARIFIYCQCRGTMVGAHQANETKAMQYVGSRIENQFWGQLKRERRIERKSFLANAQKTTGKKECRVVEKSINWKKVFVFVQRERVFFFVGIMKVFFCILCYIWPFDIGQTLAWPLGYISSSNVDKLEQLARSMQYILNWCLPKSFHIIFHLLWFLWKRLLLLLPNTFAIYS